MRIALIVAGFRASTSRLQPWLTFAEVGTRMAAHGHDVVIVTDGPAEPRPPIPSLPVETVGSLRGTNRRCVAAWLARLRPDRAVVAISPFSLATAGWHRALPRNGSLGFLAWGLPTPGEMMRALRHLPGWEKWTHAKNLLVPGALWRGALARSFRGVICQSGRIEQRLGEVGGVRTSVIPPGIDRTCWRPREETGVQEVDTRPFLFLGDPSPVRGYATLLDAVGSIPPWGGKLKVLARGASPARLRDLEREVRERGLDGRVTIVGGWLEPEALRSEIRAARAVVLPFILVLSELPVSVLESIACGTPVISTDVDGLPEAVGQGGIIVPAGDAGALARAMKELDASAERLDALRSACRSRAEEILTWDEVASRWMDVLCV